MKSLLAEGAQDLEICNQPSGLKTKFDLKLVILKRKSAACPLDTNKQKVPRPQIPMWKDSVTDTVSSYNPSF